MLQPLATLVDLQPGYQSPPGLTYDASGTHALLQSKHLESTLLDPDASCRFMPQRKPEPYTIQQGDVLILTKGHRFNASWVAHTPAHPTLANGLMMILRPRQDRIEGEYLCWLLNLPKIQRQLAEASQGTSVPYLARQALANLPVPVPSLARQASLCHAQSLISDLRKQQNALLDCYELQLQSLSLTQETPP